MAWWRYGRRMTPDCREVLAAARGVARRFGSSEVNPPHVLLALLEHQDCVGAAALFAFFRRRKALLAAIRERLEATLALKPKRKPLFSAATGILVAAAREEALRLGHLCIGTEHLLVSFLRNLSSPLAEAVATLGSEPGEVLAKILGVLWLANDDEAGSPELLLPTPQLRKEDFPLDVRSDPLVDLYLRAQGNLGDANPFVMSARRRRPNTPEQLKEYLVQEYAEAIRAIQDCGGDEAEDQDGEENETEDDN